MTSLLERGVADHVSEFVRDVPYDLSELYLLMTSRRSAELVKRLAGKSRRRRLDCAARPTDLKLVRARDIEPWVSPGRGACSQ